MAPTLSGLAVAAGLLAASCSGGDGGAVAVVRLDDGLELADARRQVAERYYAEHPDDRDMLVVWDTDDRFFGHVSYLPVANQIRGIGYQHVGLEQEVFDLSADYASTRLQGLIWLGSRWRLIGDAGSSDSALGTLLAETLHRWGAMVHHDDGGGASDRLLTSDGVHWSGLIDAGDSPLGPYRWLDLGNGQLQRVASTAVAAGDVDLYLMGLLAADQVAPLRLLVDASTGVCSQPEPCADGWRDGPPDSLVATVIEIGLDQILAAEGPRDPAPDPGAAAVRQAWIYAVHGDDEVDAAELERLEGLRGRWQELYAGATRGLGAVVTE